MCLTEEAGENASRDRLITIRRLRQHDTIFTDAFLLVLFICGSSVNSFDQFLGADDLPSVVAEKQGKLDVSRPEPDVRVFIHGVNQQIADFFRVLVIDFGNLFFAEVFPFDSGLVFLEPGMERRFVEGSDLYLLFSVDAVDFRLVRQAEVEIFNVFLHQFVRKLSAGGIGDSDGKFIGKKLVAFIVFLLLQRSLVLEISDKRNVLP